MIEIFNNYASKVSLIIMFGLIPQPGVLCNVQ